MERLGATIVMLDGWRRAGLAFFAGALLALTQAPFDFFFAGFVSFPLLVWLLDAAAVERKGRILSRFRPAFWVGWWFGFGYFLVGIWWVATALLVDADQFAWAIPLAVTVLPAGLALFYALATALARLLWSDGLGRMFALAAAFALMEWVRSFVFTGFPWNPVGFAAMPIPLLMQSVSLVGSASINALAVLVFAMPAVLSTRRHALAGLSLACLLAAAHVGFGYWQTSQPAIDGAEQTLRVRIVQPAIDQSEKWDAAVRDRIFATLLDLSGRAPDEGDEKPELILWPETSVPFLLTDRPDALVAIADLLGEGQTLLAGVVREEPEPSAPTGVVYYNSMVAIDETGVIVDAVDKVHLVPFGEYVPFEETMARLGITKVVPMPASFRAGTPASLALPKGIVASGFICYEIIFADEVMRSTRDVGMIVNITNDGWFGTTPGPYQHFRQAQIRAAETGLPVVRAANTGISGVIDDRGQVTKALALNAKGFLDVTVTTRADRKNFGEQHAPIFWGLITLLILLSGTLFLTTRRTI